jgi:hypothetical protein
MAGSSNDSGIDTCNDQRVPKQATGKTQIRTLRAADDVWLPALARADAEGIPLSEVLIAALRGYGEGQLAPARQFTFANWEEARAWADGHAAALAALGDEIDNATGFLPPEWLPVAAWLASTHHQSDPAQQKRVITGHILRRAMEVTKGGWRDRYRDSRHLSETVQAILERHLPLAAD